MNSRNLLVITLLLALFAVSCSRDGDGRAKQGKRPAPVVVTTAELRNLPINLMAVGNVMASATVQVRSRVTGELVGIHFREGADVHKGQKLFTIDPRPLESDLREARARLERSRAQLTKAEEDLRRFGKLVGEGYVSREQFDQVRSNAEALRATVKADEASVESSRLQVGYSVITSPVDARVGAVRVHVGNMVKANADDWLVTLDTIEPVYVNFSIPEGYLPAVLARQQSDGTGGAPVVAQPEGGKAVEGHVDFVDNSVDAATGTIKLRATFPNTSRGLWPGQFVSVRLSLGERSHVVTVPARAIQNGVDGQYVYVLVAGDKVEPRSVVTGVKDDGFAEIVRGLAAGERVVIEGHMRLTPGIQVAPQQASPAATGAELPATKETEPLAPAAPDSATQRNDAQPAAAPGARQ